jgi:hypothetical protein
VLVVRDTLGSLRQARANIKAQIGRRKRLERGNFSKESASSCSGRGYQTTELLLQCG